MPRLSCWLLALLLLPTLAAASERPSLSVKRASGAIHIDGLLDEPAWAEGSEVRDFQLISPREGETPSEPTSVRVLRDGDRLVFAFRCGARRRPHSGLAARDGVLDGDHISLHIDTDGDGQRAYIFGVNPYGVQVDGECVDAGDAHAVEAAGDFVGVFVKFSPGVQHGHDDFEGRFF